MKKRFELELLSLEKCWFELGSLNNQCKRCEIRRNSRAKWRITEHDSARMMQQMVQQKRKQEEPEHRGEGKNSTQWTTWYSLLLIRNSEGAKLKLFETKTREGRLINNDVEFKRWEYYNNLESLQFLCLTFQFFFTLVSQLLYFSIKYINF